MNTARLNEMLRQLV